MLRLVISKILLLLAIMVYSLTVSNGSLVPFGLMGSLVLGSVSKIVDWRITLSRGHHFRNAILNFVIFLILFRSSLTLRRLGFDINELIFNDPINQYIIFVGFVIHASIDVYYRGNQIFH